MNITFKEASSLPIKHRELKFGVCFNMSALFLLLKIVRNNVKIAPATQGTIENSWSHIVVSKDTIVSITSQDDVMQPEDSIFTKAQVSFQL